MKSKEKIRNFAIEVGTTSKWIREKVRRCKWVNAPKNVRNVCKELSFCRIAKVKCSGGRTRVVADDGRT